MHQISSASLAPANDDTRLGVNSRAARRHRFALELDRRGLFLSLGRVEAYCCTEPESAWLFQREPGGFDAQAWRLHLMVGRTPGG